MQVRRVADDEQPFIWRIIHCNASDACILVAAPMAFDRGSPTVAAFWLGRTEHDLVLPRAKVEKDILPFLAVKKGGLELAAFVL